MPAFPDDEQRNALTEDCRRCPKLAESRTCISWGNGSLSAEIVVVGEAPAEGDPEADQWQGGNLTGLAYTSRRSGQKIRQMLADAGFGHDACYYTNAVKCHPPENRDPTDAELANCRPYLVDEVEAVSPEVVLTTGKHATKTVLALDDDGFDGFTDSVLDPYQSEALGVPVVPLLHPSYQEVWLSRLGYSYDGYVATLTETVASVADT
ncbi:MAG: uracil-DNA glycosylase family protein [Haloarcula sp.]